MDDISDRYETLKRVSRLIDLVEEDFPESTYRNALLADMKALIDGLPSLTDKYLNDLNSLQKEYQTMATNQALSDLYRRRVVQAWRSLPAIVRRYIIWRNGPDFYRVRDFLEGKSHDS
jgi:hypothetical protein